MGVPNEWLNSERSEGSKPQTAPPDMTSLPEKIKEAIQQVDDPKSRGIVPMEAMLSILRIPDDQLVSILKSSGACFIDYPKLIDYVYGSEITVVSKRGSLRTNADDAKVAHQLLYPVHYASRYGTILFPMVEDLLRHSADPNAKDHNGDTPLHYAAHHNKKDVAQALLGYNANVLAQDDEGLLPIHRALLQGHDDLVELLLEAMHNVPDYQPTGDFAAKTLACGKLSPVDLVSRVVLWEAQRVSSTSSLLHHWATHNCAEAFSAACQIPLDDVVSAIAKNDENGFIPLDWAIHLNNSDITEAFLKAGSFPTRLYILEERSPEMIQILETYDPPGDCARSLALLKRKTPFEAAKGIYPEDARIMETYRLTGYDFSLENSEGKRPLHYAVEYGACHLLSLLGVVSHQASQSGFAVLMNDGGVIAWGGLGGGPSIGIQEKIAEDVQVLNSTERGFEAIKTDGTVIRWG